MGRLLIALGIVLIAAGLLFHLDEKLPLKIGRLPGDIVWRGKNTTFYFPLMTALLLSAIGSLVLFLLRKR